MYLNEHWTYLVELKGPPGHVIGMALIDLSEEDDRGDVEPFVDQKGCLRCMLGCKDEEYSEMREIVGVHKYWEDIPFNNKFPFFGMVSMRDFVGRFCDAGKFDDLDESEIIELKRHYGVLIQTEEDIVIRKRISVVGDGHEWGAIGNMVNETPIGVVCALRTTAGDLKYRASPNVRNIQPVDCDVMADFLNVVADRIEVWAGLRKETRNE